jgi:hypothetical protein
MGHTEDEEGVSLRIQRTDVKKVGSVHKMNMAGNVFVLDGERSYMQKKETSENPRMKYGHGQHVMRVWAPVRERERWRRSRRRR